MGGVWFEAGAQAGPVAPIVWRQAFPERVRKAMITADRPGGSLSISDLELAALIAHKDVLVRTIWMATDNRGSSLLVRKGVRNRHVSQGIPTSSQLFASANASLRRISQPHCWDGQCISLAALDPTTLHQLGADLRAVQAATQSRVSRQRTQSAGAAWGRWSVFCESMGIDPKQLPIDPIPILQVFVQRLCSGIAAPSCRPVRSCTVEDTMRYVGQTYSGMGTSDPHLNQHGPVDFRITALYQSWAKQDEPPRRVKPLPLTLLTQTITLAEQESSAWAEAVADCSILGFYFLLRPGEYLGVPNETTDNLFRLRDLTLWMGSRALDLFTSPIPDLQAARTFATLTFTRQKNGVRNETIGHGRSRHRRLCPVLCLVAQVITLRALHAPPATPLNAYRPASAAGHPFLRFVLPSNITRQLRATLAIYPHAAYTAQDISIRSTRAGGAMALLCAGIDRDRIRLVGRWRSDELYRYLHVQAQPVMTGLAAAMLRGGSFRLAPG